jgi:HK97 family phage major capsid protein/HK97 family phage prohead protease
MELEFVHKTHAAASPAGDPLEFVMSDDSVDRLGDVIEQDGWKLDNFLKNPIALFGHDSSFPVGTWKDVRVRGNRLQGKLELMPAVSPRLQEIHAAVNGGVLRAVSVGFKPIKVEPLADGKKGYRFIEHELVECSVVAVPANPNAIQIAKNLNISRETMDLIFGKTADNDEVTRRDLHGKPAGTHPNIGNRKMSLSEKIEQSQTRVNDLKDKISAHNAKDFGDEIPDEQHLTVGEELNARLGNEARHLDMLRASEQALGAKSEALSTAIDKTVQRIDARRPFALPKKDVKPGDYVYRALAAQLLSHISKRSIPDILRERYGDDEPTRVIADATVLRTATVPATTTMVGWAAELVQTSIGDFIDSLMPSSVYPGLSARGGRFTFGRNGTVTLPARQATPTLAGAFVAEGAPIPVRQGAFTSVSLTPRKMAVISTFTRQIAEHSTPAIEQQIRSMMQDDTAVALDTVLLDATAGSTLRPPGLRYNVAATTATSGGGFNALVGDVKALVGVLAGANSLRAPVWIMNPVDVLSLTLTQNAGGDFPFQVEANNSRLQGYPIIQSTTMPAKMVILLDAADFFSATGDEPQFSVSDQATLHMEDTAPQAIGVSGSATNPIRSLWQTDSIAVRMMLDISWAMRRTGVVAWTQTITW